MFDAHMQAKIFVSRGKRIHLARGQGHSVEVFEHQTLRWIRFGETDVQSAMDLSVPWYPVAGYCISMLAALCLRPIPEKVLSLGLGGGSIERFFAAKLPNVQTVSVEPYAVVTDLAFDFLYLPPGTTVVESTGQDYLQQCEQQHDLIFVDMFDANGHLPCLLQQAFHAQLAKNLSPGGMVMLNVVPANEAELLALLLTIRRTFPHVILSQEADSKNVVLLCSDQPLPTATEADARSHELQPLVGIEFSAALARFNTLPKPEQLY
jgi:spermidine synthase